MSFSGKIMFLFLSNLALICKNLSQTSCYCTVIQSLYLCNIFVLVQYLNRKIHIEIQISCSRVKVTLTHKQNIFARAINMGSVEYLSFSLHIWNVNGKKKPRIAKGQRSANLWLPGCTSVLKAYFDISSSQLFLSLYKDVGWCIEDAKNVKDKKGHLSSSIDMLSQWTWCFCHFVCIAQGRVFPEVGLLLKFDVFSLHQNHYLAFIALKSWDIVHDVHVQTIQSDQPEVSLHWTWFKFCKLIIKQHTQRLQYTKRICYLIL